MFPKPYLLTVLFFCQFAEQSNGVKIIRKIINSPNAPQPISVYSQAVQVDSTLYISGQVGINLDGVLAQGVENQTRLALQNIQHILQAAGSSMSNVVKTSVLLADIADYPVMNTVYAEFFSNKSPARAAFAVANLPVGALVEIEAVAVVGEIVDEDARNAEHNSASLSSFHFCLMLFGVVLITIL